MLAGCGWKTGQQVAQPVVPTATVASKSLLLPASARRAASQPVALKGTAPGPATHLADFGGRRASADAKHVANWVVDSGDAKGHAFVIVDKKDARVFVFDPEGKLLNSAPALIGAAVGDDPVPGIGEKPLKDVKPEEKTTPAGRFVAEPGVNAGGEDIVWVSYDLAVSMHRVRPLVKAERRLQRLASRTSKDNRISFGCINLPVTFYERTLKPTVARHGAIVYVLPETRTPQEQFGSYEVGQSAQIATLAPRKAVK
nr:hypothetical protein [Ramlibacter algicola]